jgi:DNA excision repair protein ERCC-4
MMLVYRFYAQAWNSPQQLPRNEMVYIRLEVETKLDELARHLPSTLAPTIGQVRAALDEIFQLSWVLTHDDLSGMNLLLDASTGHLNGVIDWADAAIRPFGFGLWGMESILGYDGPKGWTWLDDKARSCRARSAAVFKRETGLVDEQLRTIEQARKLGLLLRYGYVWKEGEFVLNDDVATLTAYLSGKLWSTNHLQIERS